MSYQKIYESGADRYDEMVEAEDWQRRLVASIAEAHSLEGSRVLELGVGTGRTTKQLCRAGAEVLGLEPADAMIRRAIDWKLGSAVGYRCHFARAEARALPCVDDWAELSLAGWVLGHSRSWFSDRWRDVIGAALDELQRVTRPGGTVMIIETLGTGFETPRPPTPELSEYYEWLVDDRGFDHSTWIRTDYNFDSVERAAKSCGFFFGNDFADEIRRRQWARVPECTGLWWRSSPGSETSSE